MNMAQSQPITFIWGPPGTGKTETLAKISIAHIKQGHRVLMLSYSNVSVDGAVLRVSELYEDSQPGILVRYGYPRKKELLDHEYLSTHQLIIHNYPKLVQEKNRLSAELKKTPRTSPRFVEILKKKKSQVFIVLCLLLQRFLKRLLIVSYMTVNLTL